MEHYNVLAMISLAISKNLNNLKTKCQQLEENFKTGCQQLLFFLSRSEILAITVKLRKRRYQSFLFLSNLISQLWVKNFALIVGKTLQSTLFFLSNGTSFSQIRGCKKRSIQPHNITMIYPEKFQNFWVSKTIFIGNKDS